MSDRTPQAQAVTPYGFIWGNVEVEHMTRLPDGSRVVGVKVNGRLRLEIYVSPAGRSVRVFTDNNKELKAQA